MKKIISTLGIIAMGMSMALLSCSDGGNNDRAAQSLLLLSGKSITPQQAATSTSIVATTISSSIAMSAVSGQISFKVDKSMTPEGIMKMLSEKRLVAYGKELRSRVIPTALIRVSGDVCTASGCNAVVSGTVSCAQGGTATLNNVSLALTITDSNLTSMKYSNHMNGSFTFANCATYSRDYLSYPQFATATLNGTLTYDGTYQMNIASMTTSGTTANLSATYNDVSTVNGSDLTINGVPGLTLANMQVNNNISLTATMTNLVSTNNGGIMTFGATINDTLTGTTSLNGTVNGQAVNKSRTFSAESFHYSYTCTLNMNEGSGVCQSTNL